MPPVNDIESTAAATTLRRTLRMSYPLLIRTDLFRSKTAFIVRLRLVRPALYVIDEACGGAGGVIDTAIGDPFSR
jgi:hypothetical protein